MPADVAASAPRLAAVVRDVLTGVLADGAGADGASIAVSGGVDSLTLAAFSHRLQAAGALRMVHAVSPAVPVAATARVRALAASEGWRLDIVDAGEFADPRYRANPLDRCFFCKSNLYETLTRLAVGPVLSGTNRDDLGDFRPGLAAARDFSVRHPYVEAGMDKAAVRALAAALDLPDVAELPASPCLASRVETGIRIEADTLRLVDRIETWLSGRIDAPALRCRVRAGGFVVEIESSAMTRLGAGGRAGLLRALRHRFPETAGIPVSIAVYRQGSAFVGDRMAAPA